MKKLFCLFFGLMTWSLFAQSVFFNPSSQVVNPSEVFTTNIEISDVENLGAFEIGLSYDEDYLQANSIVIGEFLGSTGRSVITLANNIDNENGSIDFAATTLGPEPAAPNGDGILIQIEWEATSSVDYEVSLELLINTIQITEPDGSIIPADIENGVVIISGPLNTVIESIIDCPGMLIIPIEIMGFNEVNEFSLSLLLPGEGLNYSNYQNLNSEIDDIELNVNSESIEISYSGSTVSFDDNLLLELVFIAEEAEETLLYELNWNVDECYYIGVSGALVSLYTNGTAIINPIPGVPSTIDGDEIICEASNDISYSVSEIANTNNYLWTLNPEDAGIINANGPNASIDFSEGFSGNVQLSVKGENDCGGGESSELFIDIIPKPIVEAGSDESICQGETFICQAQSSNQESILWTSSGDGSFDDENSLLTNYNPGDQDIEEGLVILKITSYPISPCGLIAEDSLILSIYHLIENVNIPEGPIMVNINQTPSSSYVTQSEYADTYSWLLNPSSAGALFENNELCSIEWNQDFSGQVQLSVLTANACNSLASDILNIEVENGVGIEEFSFQTTSITSISPNPFKEISNITYQIAQDGRISFKVFNVYGKLIKEIQNPSKGKGIFHIDFRREGLSAGLYMISLFIEGEVKDTKQIIIYP